jgi:hypothetical protein
MKINKKSKFYTPKPFKERAINFFKSLLFWKGRKKGIIHTGDITWDDVRAVFFPKDFYEKYKYLGSVPWDKKGNIFKAMEPLVVYMDKKAKPWWCPRWVLRFLHLFGSDNSIVRVRNRTLHNLEKRITKGIMIWDYKTKWSEYDLRITIAGNEEMNWLVDAIEQNFYREGRKKYLIQELAKIEPNLNWEWQSLSYLEEQYSKKVQQNY